VSVEIPRSSRFWDDHYGRGLGSGTGSVGRLAVFKAATVNSLAHRHACRSVVDLGCGDGTVAGLLDVEGYLGLDASPHAVQRCRTRFAGDDARRFEVIDILDTEPVPVADLALSLDVIYHLLEDETFEQYMARLFSAARRIVAVYADDVDDEAWPGLRWDEVRHRRFTPWVAAHAPDWRLVERIPNPFPYVEGDGRTSWADFHVFAR